MRSKILLSLVVLLAVATSLIAKDISRATAEKVAVNFFYQKTNTLGEQANYNDLNIISNQLTDQAYYVVNFENGWVIVAADDAMTPVLGYNLTGRFPSASEIGYNAKSYMKTFADEYNYIKENNVVAEADILAKWNELSTVKPLLTNVNRSRDVTEPLIPCLWNQDFPYNILCPEDASGPGDHVYVGCVSTCMIQIMYYWRYPLQGTGTHSYYIYPYGTQTVNFGEANYDYHGMQNTIDPANPWEIAEIGYHAAVSVDMMFGGDGSGAYSQDVPHALRTYFGFDNSVQYMQKSSYPVSSWEQMMQDELDDLCPIYYSGRSTDGGHAFVCDAYDGDNYYHFNFGWSGSSNGFYTLQSVGGFNLQQGMVRNIFPADPNYPYIASGNQILDYTSGSIADGSGREDYPAGMNASWLIDAQTEQDSIDFVKISFAQFNTGANDYVRIYDGATENDPLLGEFSGNTLPGDITSTSNVVLVTFSSVGTGEGFLIEYNTDPAEFCSGAQEFSEPSGTITDGSGSFYYNNSATCIFMINHPEAIKYTLDFTDFITEEGEDILSIYNGSQQLIGEYSGNTLPPTIEVETSNIFMMWGTNATVNSEGWALDYIIDGVGIEENSFENLSIYPNPTTGQLNVKFDMEASGVIDVKLMSINGQIVKQDVLEGFSGSYSNSFDLSDQAKGVYLLSITSEKGKIDKKIVLK